MKKQFILWVAAVFMLASSCKKKNTDTTTPENKTQSCLPSELTFNNDGKKHDFTYDSKGNLVSHSNTTYSYSDTKITRITTLSARSETYTVVYTLDNQGRIINSQEKRTSATASTPTQSATYTYNTDGYLVTTVKKWMDQAAEAITYTWENGNIKSAEDKQNGKTTYQSSTEVYPTNFIAYEQIFDKSTDYFLGKFYGKLPKNLIASETYASGGSENYTYTKDDKGNITSVKVGGKEVYTIAYTCK